MPDAPASPGSTGDNEGHARWSPSPPSLAPSEFELQDPVIQARLAELRRKESESPRLERRRSSSVIVEEDSAVQVTVRIGVKGICAAILGAMVLAKFFPAVAAALVVVISLGMCWNSTDEEQRARAGNWLATAAARVVRGLGQAYRDCWKYTVRR